MSFDTDGRLYNHASFVTTAGFSSPLQPLYEKVLVLQVFRKSRSTSVKNHSFLSKVR